jgi:thiol-disulfide isomerase/thioredoxin
MKYIFTFTIALLISTVAFSKSFVIKGTIKNAQVFTQIYLFKCFGTEIEKLDSSKISNESFEFKTKETMLRGFYKVGIDDKKNFMFVFENSNMELEADLKTNQMQIKESKENALYARYLSINAWHGGEFKKLDEQAQQLMELRYSNPALFNVEIGKLQAKLDSLNTILYKQLDDIAINNKGTFISKVANMFVTYDTTTVAGYFKKEEFSDEEYSRGDMLSNKIFSFVQRYYPQGDYKVAAYQVLSKCEKSNSNKEIAYITLIKAFYQNDMDYARVITEQYGREFPNSNYAKFYLSAVPKGMPKVGDIPPEIKYKDINGKDISLSSFKGKVVLLDFWASWCGPCRKENPSVVSAYNKYKDKGFTVFSVSLDSNKDQWVAAIAKDGLVWPNHLSELKGWNSEIAKNYGVRGIPAAFLLDKTGKIVATNLRGMELEQALEKLFNE